MTTIAGLRLHKPEVYCLLSDRAQAALARASLHSAELARDGRLLPAELEALRVKPAARQELIEKGFWRELEDGAIEIVDYLKHNPSRSEIEDRRRAGLERTRRHRERIVTRHVTPGCDALQPSVTSAVTELASPAPPLSLRSESSPDPDSSSVLASDPKDLGASARDSEVRAVFESWKIRHNHPRAILDRKRKRRIKARLKEGFTVEQLCQAIANAKHDPFLMGQSKEGTVYDGIDTLLRDAAQVERLIALRSNGNGHSVSRVAAPYHEPMKLEPEVPANERLSEAEIRKLTSGITRRIPA